MVEGQNSGRDALSAAKKLILAQADALRHLAPDGEITPAVVEATKEFRVALAAPAAQEPKPEPAADALAALRAYNEWMATPKLPDGRRGPSDEARERFIRLKKQALSGDTHPERPAEVDAAVRETLVKQVRDACGSESWSVRQAALEAAHKALAHLSRKEGRA